MTCEFGSGSPVLVSIWHSGGVCVHSSYSAASGYDDSTRLFGLTSPVAVSRESPPGADTSVCSVP